MKNKKALRIFVFVILVAVLAAGVAMAGDDGDVMRRNVSKTPSTESEKAAISMMKFYVPAQSSAGEVGPVDYYAYGEGDTVGDLLGSREYAKPLVYSYIDGVDEEHEEDARIDGAEISSGVAFGSRDTFVAVSLDDGESWKRANVSDVADLSSFTLLNGTEYPGDSFTAVHAVAGDKVMAAWISRYCTGGSPAYTAVDDAGLPLYPDYFGIAGDQKSIDYTLQGFPEVGEIPFGCVWTARGQLLPNDLGGYDMVWTKAERLTSGRRDANRLEIAAADGAGFSIVWQEDPQGLRPGQGLGPGEGWSGAIVNAKTDIWYSYIGWDDFDLVYDVDAEGNVVDPENPVTLRDYEDLLAAKVAVPMALPVRMTDNNICQLAGVLADVPDYCFTDFDAVPIVVNATNATNAANDFCVDTIQWTPPLEGAMPKDICVTDDGRVLMGRVGASRPRIAMHGYDLDGDAVNDSAWVLIGYEETKAMGEGTAVDTTDFVAIDIGKNLWYHSFEFNNPDYISHGNILNQPAKNPSTYDPIDGTSEFYGLQESSDLIDLGNYNFQFYETEIARRFSLISQSADKAGEKGLVAYALVKQGMINQGGPADIFGRRFVIPVDFEPTTDNPYAFENMACEYEDGSSAWAFNDGTHPYYPKGICLDTPMNVSGVEPLSCVDGGDCPTIDLMYTEVFSGTEPTGEYTWDLSQFIKVETWIQCGPVDTENPIGCDTGVNSQDNQSWENPFDIAKGHRGFLDGDFLMVMYAWSPNYKANKVGNDHYNLYARRSFDGGLTWETTPSDLHDPDYEAYTQVCTIENYLDTDIPADGGVEYCYPAGAYEQARNLSQLTGTRETILDPRYSPTGGTIDQCIDPSLGVVDCVIASLPYGDDAEHDASKFFIVYETGDNTTVAEGEATPLDLFYSRATSYGDFYENEEYCQYGGTCDETLERWFALEKNEPESGEASIRANPGGTFFYAGWNQALEIGEEEFTDMDVYFRRVLYIDDSQTWDATDFDLAPIVSILYVSHDWIDLSETSEEEVILLVGTARDGDHIGGLPEDDIDEVEWTLDGVVVTDDGDSEPKRLNYPVRNLAPGWHNFTFKAKDKGGRWSPGVSAEVFVAEKLHRVYFPVSFPEPSE